MHKEGGKRMKYIAMTAIFDVSPELSREDLDKQSDQIADALIDLEDRTTGLLDSSVSVDFAARTLEITVTVSHEGFDEGRALAHSCVNRAIDVVDKSHHTCGSSSKREDMEPTLETAELVPA